MEKLGKNAPEQTVDKAITKDERIRRLEEENKAELINYEELKKYLPELAEWMKIISRYGNVDSVSQIFRDKKDPERTFLLIFTEEHSYHISAYAPTEKRPKGYLGCITSCRKPRVGETWTRGNDLADGPYNKETFIKIIGDIVSYELKTIQFRK
jgi:hypothetical protein